MRSRRLSHPKKNLHRYGAGFIYSDKPNFVEDDHLSTLIITNQMLPAFALMSYGEAKRTNFSNPPIGRKRCSCIR